MRKKLGLCKLVDYIVVGVFSIKYAGGITKILSKHSNQQTKIERLNKDQIFTYMINAEFTLIIHQEPQFSLAKDEPLLLSLAPRIARTLALGLRSLLHTHQIYMERVGMCQQQNKTLSNGGRRIRPSQVKVLSKIRFRLGLGLALHLRSLYRVRVILLGLGCLQKP